MKFSDKIIDMEIIYSLFLLAMYLLWYNCAFIFRQRTFIRKRGH